MVKVLGLAPGDNNAGASSSSNASSGSNASNANSSGSGSSGPAKYCKADSTAYFAIPIHVNTTATTLCKAGVLSQK